MAALKITRSSGNVFADLGFDEEEAERLRVRSSLIIAIRKLIKIREKGLAPRHVRIVQKGHLRIAVPFEEGPLLDEATVEAVVRKLRGRGLR